MTARPPPPPTTNFENPSNALFDAPSTKDRKMASNESIFPFESPRQAVSCKGSNPPSLRRGGRAKILVMILCHLKSELLAPFTSRCALGFLACGALATVQSNKKPLAPNGLQHIDPAQIGHVEKRTSCSLRPCSDGALPWTTSSDPRIMKNARQGLRQWRKAPQSNQVPHRLPPKCATMARLSFCPWLPNHKKAP